METKSGHYQHPCKCMNCGLHWIACSWYSEWPQVDEDEVPSAPVCPECGSDALIRWAPREVEEFIFQVVPGEQGLHSMSVQPKLSNDPATS